MTGKRTLIIVIVTLITVVAWMGSDIYFKRERTQPPENIQELIEPINPDFDLSGVE